MWSHYYLALHLILGTFIIFNIINQFSQYCLLNHLTFLLWRVILQITKLFVMECGNSIYFTILIKYIILKTTSDRMYLSKLKILGTHSIFCRYVCIYVCINVYLYACMYVYMCICTYICMVIFDFEDWVQFRIWESRFWCQTDLDLPFTSSLTLGKLLNL